LCQGGCWTSPACLAAWLPGCLAAWLPGCLPCLPRLRCAAVGLTRTAAMRSLRPWARRRRLRPVPRRLLCPWRHAGALPGLPQRPHLRGGRTRLPRGRRPAGPAGAEQAPGAAPGAHPASRPAAAGGCGSSSLPAAAARWLLALRLPCCWQPHWPPARPAGRGARGEPSSPPSPRSCTCWASPTSSTCSRCPGSRRSAHASGREPTSPAWPRRPRAPSCTARWARGEARPGQARPEARPGQGTARGHRGSPLGDCRSRPAARGAPWLWPWPGPGGDAAGGRGVTLPRWRRAAQVGPLVPPGSFFYWLGGSDLREEGAWAWADGSAWGFSHWGDGEPNNSGEGGGAEDCLAVYSPSIGPQGDGLWNDLDCAHPLAFVCGAQGGARACIPRPAASRCCWGREVWEGVRWR
jgi:hypothetical protein